MGTRAIITQIPAPVTRKLMKSKDCQIFSKTGNTTLAGGNLTIIFKNKIGHNMAITLLGSTEEGRFSDMEKLVEIAYNLDYGTAN